MTESADRDPAGELYSLAVTANLDSVSWQRKRPTRQSVENSDAITVNLDGVSVSRSKPLSPGPETERYRRLIRRRPPTQ